MRMRSHAVSWIRMSWHQNRGVVPQRLQVQGQTAVMWKVIYVQASCSGLESLPGSTGSCDREAACRQMAGPSMWAKWGRARWGGGLWEGRASGRDEAITMQEAGSTAAVRSDNEHIDLWWQHWVKHIETATYNATGSLTSRHQPYLPWQQWWACIYTHTRRHCTMLGATDHHGSLHFYLIIDQTPITSL